LFPFVNSCGQGEAKKTCALVIPSRRKKLRFTPNVWFPGGVATNVEGQEGVEKKGEQSSSMTASSLLSSALGGLGLAGGKVEGAEEDKQGGDANAASLTGAFNSLSKAAVGATKTIKEKVGTANVIAEFNKEQASFIKSKGELVVDLRQSFQGFHYGVSSG
jgi:hypothetical protein